jgi:NADH-quinone oxidoreductase subunit F
MNTPLTKNIHPDSRAPTFAEYQAGGGFGALKKALAIEPAALIQLIKDAGLLGRGGAGFSTGIKMSAVPQGPNAPKQKYLIANADEMEPGTFKDRLLLEGVPHQLIEGMIIGAHAIGANTAYIFLRGEYKEAERRLLTAIAECYSNNCLGANILGTAFSLELHLHTSGGRYICGDETALVNALEGKRATPRSKPPFLQVSGFFGRPTLVQNVETLSNLPHIVANGAEWYRGLTRAVDAGTKIYGVSGNVKKPGAFELPMGTPMRELLEVHAGGMKEGYRFRALLPGGASTDFLLEEHLDTPMDYSSMAKIGTRMGTGTMIVLDDKTCPVGMVLNLERFFKQESCGFCTPCRDGLSWITDILMSIERGEGRAGDVALLMEHAGLLGPGSTFCALAPGAAAPLKTALKHFAKDFEQHIQEKRCPYA